MPYIRISYLEGKSEEQIEKLAAAITDSVAEIFKVKDKSHIWIQFEEMPKNRFAQSGVLRSKQ